MKFPKAAKCILAAILFGTILCVECFAAVTVTDTPELGTTKQGPADDRFPFVIESDAIEVDRLCYAGHMQGGGIFYDDGKMVLPASQFHIVAQAGGAENFGELSAEVTLLYENAQNSGCTREIIRKYPRGSLSAGGFYGFFSESAVKSLTQRKKLYSSDLSSIRVTLTYRDRTKTALFYVTKDADLEEAAGKEAAKKK